MDNQEIKELLELIRDSGIEEFEMEKAGVRLRIRNTAACHAPTEPQASVPAHPPQTAVTAGSLTAAPEPEEDLHIFRAPIVGTFYLTPKPDAEPFVQIGDVIKKNSVVCIIEAMKIFNQIESDVAGEVVDILVENGQPVEFGEPLFKIRPA
jgi:oxaloacetate decarboxylase (Na+ extruding) subunit alpha